MSIINLTEVAASEVKRIIAETGDEDQVYLRLRIIGGGCSGFSTKLDVDPVYNEKMDQLFEQHGVKVVVDNRSILYANGATIDYLTDLNKRGFKVDLPGATGQCGCGSSYNFS